MLDTTNQTKNMLERLGRATAAPHAHEIKEGKAENPLSAVNWTLENEGRIMPASELVPRPYKVNMLRHGKVIGSEVIQIGECKEQEEMDEFVKSMFSKYMPKPEKRGPGRPPSDQSAAA